MLTKIIDQAFKIMYYLYLTISVILLFIFSTDFFHWADKIKNSITGIEIVVYSLILSFLFVAIKKRNKAIFLLFKVFLMMLLVILPFYYYYS